MCGSSPPPVSRVLQDIGKHSTCLLARLLTCLVIEVSTLHGKSKKWHVQSIKQS